jgi:type IV fimbrial biogenesis protein FimT
MTARRRRSRGFTLVELMVTLAVAAVLLLLAAPAFTSFLRSSELGAAANGLLAALNAARGEAMKTSRRAVAVPADGSQWSSGWIVFVDINADRRFTEGTDRKILQQGPLPSYFGVSASGSADGTAPFIQFDASGYPRNASGGFGALSFDITRSDVDSDEAALQQARRIKVSSAGQIRTCRPSDPNC